jgi:hypothetical protein
VLDFMLLVRAAIASACIHYAIGQTFTVAFSIYAGTLEFISKKQKAKSNSIAAS